jgi:hypothetical protein
MNALEGKFKNLALSENMQRARHRLPAVKKELANAGSVCRTSGARDFLFATVTQPLRTGLTCDAPTGALETESALVKAQSKQEAVAATKIHALEAVARDALKRSPYRGGTCYENSTAATHRKIDYLGC